MSDTILVTFHNPKDSIFFSTSTYIYSVSEKLTLTKLSYLEYLVLWHVDPLLGNDCGISKYTTAAAK
jgi:hypothetical protein